MSTSGRPGQAPSERLEDEAEELVVEEGLEELDAVAVLAIVRFANRLQDLLHMP